MMKDLVLEFIPELKDADNNTIILTKYNLPIDLFSIVDTPLDVAKVETIITPQPIIAQPIIANKKIVIKKKTDVVKVESVSVSSVTIVPEVVKVELDTVSVSVSSATIVPEVIKKKIVIKKK